MIFTLYSNVTGLRIIKNDGRHVESADRNALERYRLSLGYDRDNWYIASLDATWMDQLTKQYGAPIGNSNHP